MNPALLAQLLRQQQGGANPMLAQPNAPADPLRLPTMRSEDPDFLPSLMEPLNAEQAQFQRQLQQAQALMQGGGYKASTPTGAALSGLADMIRAWGGANKASTAEAGLRANIAKQKDLVARYGKGPSASAVSRNEAGLGRQFQELMQGRQQDFSAGQQRDSLEAQAKENAKQRAFQREMEGLKGERAKVEAEKKLKEEQTKAADKLRTEFQDLPEVKAFRSNTEPNYKIFKKAVANPTGAAGTTTIFTFMKLIDPGVAVMGGDVDLIRASGGPAAKYADLLQYAQTGNPLPAKVRKELDEMADVIYAAKSKQVDDAVSRYRGLASDTGSDPDRVAVQRVPMPPNLDLNAPPPPTSAGSSAESEALRWAKENPDDPRAAEILSELGVK